MGTTAKIPVAPGLLKEEKLKFQRDIKTLQQQYDIPDELILNYDQTPLSYVCAPNHTLHTRGEANIPLIGKGKKKQITGTFTVTKSGDFLPMQIIYQGKTIRCHPQGVVFPEGFNITHTPNHWSNEEKSIELLEEIVFPYLSRKRAELNLPDDQKALLIFDVFKGQKTQRILDLMVENHSVYVFVPNNLTNEFQPLDLTVNGPSKSFLSGKFQDWYAQQITTQMQAGTDVYSINVKTNLSIIKPIHAQWVIGLYDYLRNKTDLIIKGFEIAGITEAINFDLEPEDPFTDLD